MWRQHFQGLFNCVEDDNVTQLVVDQVYSNAIVVHANEVESAVHVLDSNKSSGLDGIFVEHLKYCSRKLLTMLAMCLTWLFTRGFLPSNMLSIVLIPVIKDKSGRISQKDNYRPIALAGIVSKIVESILLNRISNTLETTCNQFGCKPKLGCDTCIYMF